MTCRPMFCEGKATCPDLLCPGHPQNSDEAMDRRIQEAEARQPALSIQYVGREPFDWQLLVIWIAVAVAFGAVAAMSFGPQIAELIDTLWPRLVYATSF